MRVRWTKAGTNDDPYNPWAGKGKPIPANTAGAAGPMSDQVTAPVPPAAGVSSDPHTRYINLLHPPAPTRDVSLWQIVPAYLKGSDPRPEHADYVVAAVAYPYPMVKPHLGTQGVQSSRLQ